MDPDQAIADQLLAEDEAIARMAQDEEGAGEDFARAAIERNRRMMTQRRDGANPMGQAFSFQDRRSEMLAVQRYSIICGAVTSAIILLILLLIAEYYRKIGVSCGIPVILWVEIFFVIFFGLYIFNLFMLIVIYKCWNDRMPYQIGMYIFFGVLLFAWTIYGYVIYFSDDNDCQERPGTSGWLIFMVILMVLSLLFFAVLLCCVLPLVLYIMHLQNQQMRGPDGLEDEEIPQVIEKLNRTPFDPNKFTFENQCKICLMDYEDEDEITQLKCDERHYFHSECIIRWISEGKNNCPLCRKPIENVEQLREMMEGGEFSSICPQEVRRNNRSSNYSQSPSGSAPQRRSNRSQRDLDEGTNLLQE